MNCCKSEILTNYLIHRKPQNHFYLFCAHTFYGKRASRNKIIAHRAEQGKKCYFVRIRITCQFFSSCSEHSSLPSQDSVRSSFSSWSSSPRFSSLWNDFLLALLPRFNNSGRVKRPTMRRSYAYFMRMRLWEIWAALSCFRTSCQVVHLNVAFSNYFNS